MPHGAAADDYRPVLESTHRVVVGYEGGGRRDFPRWRSPEQRGVRAGRHALAMDRLRPDAIDTLATAQTDPCPWCQARNSLFWVRSHVQCRACGQVVESCCEGPAGCA